MGIVAKALRLAAAVALSVPLAHPQTPSSGSIEGDVIDVSTGRGIEGARVRIRTGQGDLLDVIADSQGHFRFVGLEFGSYLLSARYPGFASPDGPMEASATTAIQALSGQPTRVQMGMQRYAAIAGKVTDAASVPMQGKTIEAFKLFTGRDQRLATRFADGNLYTRAQSVQTDDLGDYRFAPLGVGSYLVRVQAGGAPARDTYYPRALQLSEAKLLELAEGREVRADIQIVQQLGVKISGRILGGSTQPNLRVSVFASDVPRPVPSSSSQVDGVTATEGRYSLSYVPPGKYNLGQSVRQWRFEPHSPGTGASRR
jgi:hypothetical protein